MPLFSKILRVIVYIDVLSLHRN